MQFKASFVFIALVGLVSANPTGLLSFRSDECVCEPYFCIQSFPEGCYCANDNKRRCFEQCGGDPPVYQDCSLDAYSPKAEVYERCGSRGLPACPDGTVCLDDPTLPPGSCGTACDVPGYCIAPEQCGGFAGTECRQGQECVDDPRDDCDPTQGGADCIGYCFTPQSNPE